MLVNVGAALSRVLSRGKYAVTYAAAGPQIVRAAVSSLKAGAGDAESADVSLTRDYGHTFAETAVIAAPAADVTALLFDLSRYPEWFTVHAGWPEGPPKTLSERDSFTQDARVMGTPARVKWTVTERTSLGMALEGEGPMGSHVGLAFSVVPHGDEVRVSVAGGFESDALKGPMGALVSRALHSATTESLGQLAIVVSGSRSATPAADVSAATAAPREKPETLTHPDTGETIDPWAPVIIGVGQHVNRPSESKAIDPVSLAARAVRAAIKDCENPNVVDGLIGVSAVPSTSWMYGELQAALLANELGITATTLMQSAPLGGEGPLRLINEAASAISAGHLDVAIVAGAESFASLATLEDVPDWDREQPGSRARVVGTDRSGNNSAEEAAGLLTPVVMYALLETAMRGKLGRTKEEHLDAIARLWARYSEVAADNPAAWVRRRHTASEIATPSMDNRPVADPYTKLMTANLTVDQGAAVLMCSAAAASAAGIPLEKWVFVHAGAHANEEWFVSERHDLASAPAIGAVGNAVLRHTQTNITDIAHFDLYSCFPFAVEAAAIEMGIALDKRPATCTGGLTFAGGPLNNYSTHGVASLVQVLRKDPGARGMVTALGWYATKHAAAILSTAVPQQPYRDIDAGLRMQRPPARQVLEHFSGSAIVESYTVTYTSSGEPNAAIFSLLTEGGDRVLRRSTTTDVVDAAVQRDLLGVKIQVSEDSLTVEEGPANASRVRMLLTETRRESSLRVEWEGPLCILTLNRPRVRNAIDLDTALAIERALDAFDADEDAQVAILTGAGGDFCTGMDLKAAARGQFPMAPNRGLLGMTRRPPRKPIIAAIEGNALAGGFELALACDMIVAAEDAVFGLPEVKRGLVAAAGGVMRLARRLPRAVALQIALTGEPLDARRLYDLGLVNALTEPGETLKRARSLAETIAVNAPLSLQLSKRIVDESPDWTTTEAFDRQSEIAALASFSEDATEGIRAFEEKRQPRWKGR